MGERENRETVERMIQALNGRDLDSFNERFHDDSLIDYPQSGERIVGAENRRAVFEALPTRPRITPRRTVSGGELVVAEASVDYGDGTEWRAVFICELQGGKVAKWTAYFTQPFDRAGWRSQWVETIDA